MIRIICKQTAYYPNPTWKAHMADNSESVGWGKTAAEALGDLLLCYARHGFATIYFQHNDILPQESPKPADNEV